MATYPMTPHDLGRPQCPAPAAWASWVQLPRWWDWSEATESLSTPSVSQASQREGWLRDCYGLNCVPSCVEVLTPSSCDITLFGNRVTVDSKVKMRSLIKVSLLKDRLTQGQHHMTTQTGSRTTTGQGRGLDHEPPPSLMQNQPQ